MQRKIKFVEKRLRAWVKVLSIQEYNKNHNFRCVLGAPCSTRKLQAGTRNRYETIRYCIFRCMWCSYFAKYFRFHETNYLFYNIMYYFAHIEYWYGLNWTLYDFLRGLIIAFRLRVSNCGLRLTVSSSLSPIRSGGVTKHRIRPKYKSFCMDRSVLTIERVRCCVWVPSAGGWVHCLGCRRSDGLYGVIRGN